ncbi:hypothetical protein ACI77J_04275 [Pseudomonas sp. O64]|uniref:hypothetical protein n=1 Tax=unclassified Pseudomonas TaxID=196821 RepID=UPI0021D9A651|nr:hypothetical protein [Pseudomonas sp. YeP6b]UXZ22405.1 hypothetical protein KZH41_28780 [Pseudomonas sp. YeP6b]
MPPRYRVLSVALDGYYSDFFTDRLEDELGFDPVNPANVAYAKYNKPYARFQYLGGFGLAVPATALPVTPQPGDKWDIDIQNLTTGSPSAVFNYSYTFLSGSEGRSLRALVGMPAMQVLGPGLIEINASFTSNAANTVYIFQPKQITLVAP